MFSTLLLLGHCVSLVKGVLYMSSLFWNKYTIVRSWTIKIYITLSGIAIIGDGPNYTKKRQWFDCWRQ